MMSVTVVVDVKSKEGTKWTLDSSVNLSLGLVRAGLGLDNFLREYPYLKGRTWSVCYSLRSSSCLDKAVRPGIRFEVFLVLGCQGEAFLERVAPTNRFRISIPLPAFSRLESIFAASSDAPSI